MADMYIGRQPVLDGEQNVWGYELLFRSNAENRASFDDAQQATSQVILNALLEFGLERVVGDAKALVNLPRDFLLGEQADLLPPQQVVLEVLEDVVVDEAVVSGVRRLRDVGYMMALDDFAFEAHWEPLLEMADLIKVEVPAIAPEVRDGLRQRFKDIKRRGTRLLAEKVETHEEFEAYKALGFDLFQGYFFSRPNVMQSSRIPGNRTQALQLMCELNREDVQMRSLETLIKTNVDLSYKILRFVNSARYAIARDIDSVRDALVLMGLKQLRTLANMVVLAGIDDKPSELVELSLIRARMCEQLSEHENANCCEAAFTVGMLSTLDALLDRPLVEVVADLPVAPEISAALLAKEGRLGRYLSWTLACENSDGAALAATGLSASDMSSLYVDAWSWARETQLVLAKL